MAAKVAGINSLVWNGQTVNVVGTVSYDVGGYSLETMMGLDGVHGAAQKFAAPSIKFTMRDMDGFSWASARANLNNTVYIDCANGKEVVGSNMWIEGDVETNVDDGSVALTLHGLLGSVTEN